MRRSPPSRNAGPGSPARVNFTSEGRPGQVGSGQGALDTLFHEGGHAAHFANVAQASPCFSQEYPPTSMAYAETQSMFCDSILGDADWLTRYAKRTDGAPMPPELIKRRIDRNQPFRAFGERMLLVVPYFERDLYALADYELSGDRVLAMARASERRILGVDSPRPVLAIPHFLSQEAAASYHGYLLADMAVYQTRAWFLERIRLYSRQPRRREAPRREVLGARQLPHPRPDAARPDRAGILRRLSRRGLRRDGRGGLGERRGVDGRIALPSLPYGLPHRASTRR